MGGDKVPHRSGGMADAMTTKTTVQSETSSHGNGQMDRSVSQSEQRVMHAPITLQTIPSTWTCGRWSSKFSVATPLYYFCCTFCSCHSLLFFSVIIGLPLYTVRPPVYLPASCLPAWLYANTVRTYVESIHCIIFVHYILDSYVYHIVVRGEPERAPNTRVTYGEFAVPMCVCMYLCNVAIRRPRVYHACANTRTVKIVMMLY